MSGGHGSDILDHFATRAPAPEISISAIHDGKGWLLRATQEGFEPFLFGGWAETLKDANWIGELFAQSIGATWTGRRLH